MATLKQTQTEIRELGARCKRTFDGEVKVWFPGCTEAQVYFTNDLEDAYGTAWTMVLWSQDQR